MDLQDIYNYFTVIIDLLFLKKQLVFCCTNEKSIEENIEKYDICEKILKHCAGLCDNKNGHKYYKNISMMLNTFIINKEEQNYNMCNCNIHFTSIIKLYYKKYSIFDTIVSELAKWDADNILLHKKYLQRHSYGYSPWCIPFCRCKQPTIKRNGFLPDKTKISMANYEIYKYLRKYYRVSDVSHTITILKHLKSNIRTEQCVNVVYCSFESYHQLNLFVVFVKTIINNFFVGEDIVVKTQCRTFSGKSHYSVVIGKLADIPFNFKRLNYGFFGNIVDINFEYTYEWRCQNNLIFINSQSTKDLTPFVIDRVKYSYVKIFYVPLVYSFI